MVLYFSSNVVSPSAYIYMGRDKFENEDLIKYGWSEDVCAHVYLRLPAKQTWDSIDEKLLNDCAQLTKANSIDGNKRDNITIIYTPWSNLKKDGSMATGQVSFTDQKMVKKIFIETRENAIINRLNKTKVEKQPDLQQERDDHVKELQDAKNRIRAKEIEAEKLQKADYQKQKYAQVHAYDGWDDEEAKAEATNQGKDEDYLDDFM